MTVSPDRPSSRQGCTCVVPTGDHGHRHFKIETVYYKKKCGLRGRSFHPIWAELHDETGGLSNALAVNRLRCGRATQPWICPSCSFRFEIWVFFLAAKHNVFSVPALYVVSLTSILPQVHTHFSTFPAQRENGDIFLIQAGSNLSSTSLMSPDAASFKWDQVEQRLHVLMACAC